MHQLAVILLTFLLADQGSAVDNPDCSGGPPGLYCLNDLSGYLSCAANGSKPVTVSCPVNTRCKCFLRNRCSDESPCTTFRRPAPWPKSFTLRYSGIRHVSGPQGTNAIRLRGIWKRDEDAQKFHKVDWEGALRKFQLVVANSMGSFHKFEGTYPSTCTRAIVNALPDLDISLFTYVGMELVNQVKADRWDFLIGARNLGESSTQTSWYSVYDDSIQSYRPARFTESYAGGATLKTKIVTDWTVDEFTSKAGGEVWFQVPPFCMK